MRGNRERPAQKQQPNIQNCPPLGLAYLASYLEKYTSFKVELIDVQVESVSIEEMALRLKKINPFAIGISVTSFSLFYTYTLIQKIRALMDVNIIIGGPHVSSDPKSVFELGANYGIVGEGEISLTMLLKSLSDGSKPNGIAGLVWKRDNKIFVNTSNKARDLNGLPFPSWHLLSSNRYYHALFPGKFMTMITSRGCPYDCIFCATPFVRSYRERSAENVVLEIKEIINQKYNWIVFCDDIFTLHKDRTKEICNLILEKNVKINWACASRADLVDKDLLVLMKKAGCQHIHYGVETGVEQIRYRVINKSIDDNLIKEVFKVSQKAGLLTTAFIMFGHPTETVNDMKQTLRFINELQPNYIDITLATCIPGSKLFELACKEGKISGKIWNNVAKGKKSIPIYIPDGITFKQMREFQARGYIKFYFNLKFILKRLSIIRSYKEIMHLYKAFLRLCILLKNNTDLR